MPGEKFAYFYRGASMRGTFRAGDYLTVIPVALREIRPGDIVIYRKPMSVPDDDDTVAHRVIKVMPGGLIMRGDFNPASDLTVVMEEDIVGRVARFERRGKTRAVIGGRIGLLCGRWFHVWHPARLRFQRAIRRRVVPLGRWFYHWLRTSGVIARVWRPPLTRISLTTPHGPIVKYTHRGRTVAVWWSQRRRLQCRKPYDLILWRELPLSEKTAPPAEIRSDLHSPL